METKKELKTLKDIPLSPADLNRNELIKQLRKADFNPMILYKNRIKQEAIKRIKHYRELIEKGGLTTSEVGHYSGRIAELKEFNNLTEKDLK